MRIWQWLKSDRAKFVRETANIVLGVLIALGLGEVADGLNWRVKVRDSEAAVRAELARTRFVYAERLMLQGCLERRLDAIGQVLATAHRSSRLPAIASVGQPSKRIITSMAFDIAKSEGVSLHMDPERWQHLALLAEMTHSYDTVARQEWDDWDILSLLKGPARPVDAMLLANLDMAWARAVGRAQLVGVIAQQADAEAAATAIPIMDFPDEPLADLAARNSTDPRCRPLMVDGRPFPASARQGG